MRKFVMMAAAAFMLCTTAQAQLNPMEPIPMDPAVRTGKLENGMTYYIRHNEKPKGSANFYILHNVGAVQENDEQQGLAHFLEHMAFNGTKNLPGKQMINYLETIGVKFGANLNAYTSYDETSYMIEDVPTTRQGIIDTAMLILHDWSHFIALNPEEIDSERGVIMEELRTRDGAQWRSQVNMLKQLGKGSIYEERNVIGYLEGLKSFDHGKLEAFYHTWYRPDYQAVVIVGDIDVDATEAALKKLMADIPAPAADAPQKQPVVIPDNQEPIISVFTDPEMTRSSASIYIKRPAMPNEANGLVLKEMTTIVTALIAEMQNARIQELAMQPDAPFLGGGMFDGNLGIIPMHDFTVYTVTTQDGKLNTGFEAILKELEKTRRYGFTEGEFERAQANLLSSCERSYANRNDRLNEEFHDRMLANFKFGTPVPDAEYEWKLDSTLLNLITVNDVNAVSQQLLQPTNWVVIVNAPEKEGIVNPTPEELGTMIETVRSAELEAYEDSAVKEPLIANLKALKGSRVAQTKQNETLGTTEWTLKNGIKVVVKPTTFKADEVMLHAESEGGTSLLSDLTDFYTGSLMPEVMGMSGIGKFSATDLTKQLAGKNVSVTGYVDNYSHGVEASSTPKDLETMFQLLYLTYTEPRFDENDYNTFMTMVRSAVENLLKNPDYILQDKMLETLYDNNPRMQALSPEILDIIRFDRMAPIHAELFGAANNFTFTIVGNVDLETLKPMVEKYLGSLPVSKQKLSMKDDGIQPVKGEVVNDFRTPMQQPKVSVIYTFTGKEPYTMENRTQMYYLSQALNARYLQSIREEKGGTYGVQVGGKVVAEPDNRYSMVIAFDTNEEMADELMEIIMQEIRKIAEEGPLADDMQKTREYLLKDWKSSLEMNSQWMNYICRYYKYGFDYMKDYERIVNETSGADIQKLVQKILADGNMVKVVMRPEIQAAE